FMPRMISITYFTQQFNQTTLASSTDMVILLYKAYCKVLTQHEKADQIPDFDNFYFWGSVLLKDFNEVDAYLANAKDYSQILSDSRKSRLSISQTNRRK
ncbi:MAG: hypothetical protein K2K37_01625, partial [Muribaculaceae bacterium]|nr:hypothetical protein [Muribaculaceae bacterium]